METTQKPSASRRPAVRTSSLQCLVESALRKVAAERVVAHPRTRREWVEHLTEAVISGAETPYSAVLGAMIGSGITQHEILHCYVPEVARNLGEMWLNDTATFMDVTIGVGRLQRLYRDHGQPNPASWSARTVPLGQSVLMVISPFEEHSLGAFAAADSLRRHGLWVHMAIGMAPRELAEVIGGGPFTMVGLSVSTVESLDETAHLIGFLRSRLADPPPIVVGGRVVELINDVAQRSGADYAVRNAREAVTKCGLASVSSSPAQELIG